jgi:hypothetical protein
MTSTEDFQDRGEPWRQMFGIDGTAGDAQDEPHLFVPDTPGGGPCVVCGLARAYRRHTGDFADGGSS